MKMQSLRTFLNSRVGSVVQQLRLLGIEWATIGSTCFEDLERGTFASEELELLPAELTKGFSVEKELIAETRADNEE